MTFRSTKLFGPLSAAFRQHSAKSHCNLIHGYGLTFRVTFEAETLDSRNWVVDFGGLKSLKELYETQFDHKLLVAEDDPQWKMFKALEDAGVAELVTLPAVGCEAFAKHAWALASKWLDDNVTSIDEALRPRVHVAEVECFEHHINSASFLA